MKPKIALNDPAFLSDRRGFFRKLRRDTPVVFADLNGEEIVVVTRYADADLILRQKETTVQASPGEVPAHVGNGAASVYYRLNLASSDPPYHLQVRKIMQPYFGPQAIAKMQGWMGEVVDGLLEKAAQAGSLDIVPNIALALPIHIACRLFAISEEDCYFLLSRINDMTAILSQSELSKEDLVLSDNATEMYFKFFADLMDNTAVSGGLFLDVMRRAEAENILNRDEVLVAFLTVFIASIHTTMTAVSNVIKALGDHPEQQQALANDPSLAQAAWDEMLRYDPPVHFRHRYLRNPLTLHGIDIHPGRKIMIALASTNWDEQEFEAPDTYNIRRPPPRHVAFGGGSHFCLGAHLARMEGRLFLSRFLARFPNYKIADVPIRRNNDLTFPHMENLVVDLHP